jgi:3-hydroxybutyrate dehydrogenase
MVSNAGIQIVAPIEDFKFADWKKLIAVHWTAASSPRARRCGR